MKIEKFYQRLSKSEKKLFIKNMCEKCDLKDGTVRNGVSGHTKFGWKHFDTIIKLTKNAVTKKDLIN